MLLAETSKDEVTHSVAYVRSLQSRIIGAQRARTEHTSTGTTKNARPGGPVEEENAPAQASWKARNSTPLLNNDGVSLLGDLHTAEMGTEEPASPHFSTVSVRAAQRQIRSTTMDISSRTGRSLDGGVIAHGDIRGVRTGDHVDGNGSGDAVMMIYKRRLKSDLSRSIYLLRSCF